MFVNHGWKMLEMVNFLILSHDLDTFGRNLILYKFNLEKHWLFGSGLLDFEAQML